MKVLYFLISFFIFSHTGFAQNANPFDFTKKGKKQLLKAVDDAKPRQKHVLVIVGQNNKPCKKFIRFMNFENDIYEYIQKNYVVVYLNYGKHNRNYNVMAELGFPDRLTLPVLVVLDYFGNRLVTQNTVPFLNSENLYSRKKTMSFLRKYISKTKN